MFQEWRNQTLPGVLQYSARNWPDRVAISFASEQITYAALSQRVAGVRQGLQAAGVQHGDHVACFMASSPRWLEVVFAAAELGATLVPLNLTWTDDEVIQGLTLTECDVLLIGAQHKGRSLPERVPALLKKSAVSGGPTL